MGCTSMAQTRHRIRPGGTYGTVGIFPESGLHPALHKNHTVAINELLYLKNAGAQIIHVFTSNEYVISKGPFNDYVDKMR